jgi:ABC-type amino acid transport substrate-binding protein
MVMRKGADALTAKVNRALKQIRKDGTYRQVYNRWLAVP